MSSTARRLRPAMLVFRQVDILRSSGRHLDSVVAASSTGQAASSLIIFGQKFSSAERVSPQLTLQSRQHSLFMLHTSVGLQPFAELGIVGKRGAARGLTSPEFSHKTARGAAPQLSLLFLNSFFIVCLSLLGRPSISCF